MKCLQKILTIPSLHLYIPYLLNVVSVIANAQNHIQIEGRQTNTNSDFLEVYQSSNIHPLGHHSSFRNGKKTLTTKFFFGRNNILEVAFRASYSKGYSQMQPPELLCKKVFLKISQNSQKNTQCQNRFLIKEKIL